MALSDVISRCPSPSPSLRFFSFLFAQEREPANLLTPLRSQLCSAGVGLDHALFVPPLSQYSSLRKEATTDLSWQRSLQGVWDQQGAASSRKPPLPRIPWSSGRAAVMSNLQVRNLIEMEECLCDTEDVGRLLEHPRIHEQWCSRCPRLPRSVASMPVTCSFRHVFRSPFLYSQVTLEWCRQCVRASPNVRLQVLVTGSLYMVGDMLKLLNHTRVK